MAFWARQAADRLRQGGAERGHFVQTSEVIYSTAGAGEYSLSIAVVGFSGTASYDSTLNGKVLDLAIRQAVDSLVNGIEAQVPAAPG